MRFAKDFPDQLRSQILTSNVVGKRVALKQRGKEHTGLCPFHHEKTSSFTVNDQKGFYHCFGCSAHGDVITFLMEIDGLNFKEAVIKLADDYAITIPFIKTTKTVEQEKEYEDKIAKNYLLLEKACKFFEDNLFIYQGAKALDYLHKRGLNNQNIKNFRLGFAIDDFEALVNNLKNQGFKSQEFLESGIIAKNKSGKLYDKFRGRIIFPILDHKDRVIAFGGRALGDVMPKYLNSSETEIFKKGQSLYNYSKSRSSIYEQKFACIVEGYMDVISLSVNGIKNVVAPLGTAVTSDQLQGLFRITEDAVICLDGDTAGVNAMRRVIDVSLPLINAKNNIRFAFLPSGMDPDDFIKLNGRDVLQNLLKNAKNLSETLFDYETKDLGLYGVVGKVVPEIKVKLEKKLMQKVNLIIDGNSKRHFTQYYKDLLFLIGKKQSKITRLTSSLSASQSSSFLVDFTDIYANNIIIMLVLYPDLTKLKDQYCNVRELDFENEELANLKEILIDFIDNNQNCNIDDIIAHLQQFCPVENIRSKISLDNKVIYDLDNAKLRLKVLVLKYYHSQVSKQYKEILNNIDSVETDQISIKSGRQKEMFDYKTSLERQILQLENEMI